MHFHCHKIIRIVCAVFSVFVINAEMLTAQTFSGEPAQYAFSKPDAKQPGNNNENDLHYPEQILKTNTDTINDTLPEKKKSWSYIYGIDLNLSNFFEVNSPTPPDKKNFSLASAIDLGLDYKRDSGRFQMTNEFHWLLEVQKTDLSDTSYMKKIVDDLKTLHDFAISASRKKIWSLNLIAKTTTSVFTIFDGDYFKDHNKMGRIKGFINPYDVILSPGVKYQPTEYFRFSVSPYSMSLFGFESQQIANTGLYSDDSDSDGVYELFVFKPLGAEANIWYDRNIKDKLIFQYRVGISTDYFTNIGKNGLLEGLFITKIRIVKNLYLTHRATLNGNFAVKPFRPYYGQIIMLGFAKSL